MDQRFFVTDELLASGILRFLNYIIDLIIQYAFFFMFAFLLAIIAGITGNGKLLDWITDMNAAEEYGVGMIMIILYYNAMEIPFNRTVGKFITGTIVVDENGEKPDTKDIIKRTLCRLIPFDGISFLGNNNRGWHDSIPDLYVVNKKLLDEAKQQFQDFNDFGNTEADL